MLWLSSIAVAQNPNSNAGGINWKLSGNQATSSDFIGTTNNQNLVLKCNNITALEIAPNSESKFMGDVFLEKLKPVTPLPPNEVRIVTADNNGKLTSLDRSGLVSAIYDPQIQCPIDLNGLFVPVWSAKGLTPTLGALYTGVNCPAWVGIGTDNPTASLDVRGRGLFTQSLQVSTNATKFVVGNAGGHDLGYGTSYIGFNATRIGDATHLWQTSSDGPHNGGAVIYGDIFGSLRFVTLPYTNTPNQGQTAVPDATVAQNTRLFIHKDGNVVIGESPFFSDVKFLVDANNNKVASCFVQESNNDWDYGVKSVVSRNNHKAIAVINTSFANSPDVFRVMGDGNVLCTEMTVQPAPFPDYVFNVDYSLMPLNELEKYIKENKHLPNIPTAKEVKENGLQVGDMQVKQMEKIEELTLYIIALEKRIKELEIMKKQ
ncbi:MAG: hypothetical protein COW67_12080 [Flavobacteriales bacterium CG18_big_fil_WC_8_21_14_2_50_32_9]|nr:MAG: hypothetical protein COW67_12080 [Flavobacteriales bacterium CG18_big_fil_WC_8_21_14_2_50_32_9]